MLLKMTKIQRNSGVTFIELLVAIVILAATIAGLVGLFGATKRWIEVSQSRMTVCEIGKDVLDPLQMQVRDDTWNAPNNCLTTGTNCGPASITIQNRQYNVQYNVAAGPLNLRSVKVDVTWSEPDY